MHLWDQKSQEIQHKNPLKNGSLSENVMKEGERVPFRPLSSRFLKENLFWGVPVLGFLFFLVPKVHWGLKSMWKKFQKFAKKIDDLPRNFLQPTLSFSF